MCGICPVIYSAVEWQYAQVSEFGDLIYVNVVLYMKFF